MYYSNYSDDFSQNSYLKVELRNGLTGQNYSYQYNWGNNWGNNWDDDFGIIGGAPSTPSTPSTLIIREKLNSTYLSVFLKLESFS